MCPESKGQCSLPKTSNRLKHSDHDDVVSLPVGTVEVARLLHVKQLKIQGGASGGAIGGRFHSSLSYV